MQYYCTVQLDAVYRWSVYSCRSVHCAVCGDADGGPCATQKEQTDELSRQTADDTSCWDTQTGLSSTAPRPGRCLQQEAPAGYRRSRHRHSVRAQATERAVPIGTAPWSARHTPIGGGDTTLCRVPRLATRALAALSRPRTWLADRPTRAAPTSCHGYLAPSNPSSRRMIHTYRHLLRYSCAALPWCALSP